jgi:hypothetical protein
VGPNPELFLPVSGPVTTFPGYQPHYSPSQSLSRFAHVSQTDGRYGEGEFSVRKSLDSSRNVTVRDSERSKDRPQDVDYRRASISSQILPTSFPLSRKPTPTPEPETRFQQAVRNDAVRGASKGDLNAHWPVHLCKSVSPMTPSRYHSFQFHLNLP